MNSNGNFELAQLSEASYTLFDTSVYGDQERLKSYLQNSALEGDFSLTQAADFVAHWEIVDHLPNTASGFSGTVFRRRDSDPATGLVAGDLVFVLRGTEQVGLDLFQADFNELVNNGLAFRQIIDMYNYWQRLITPTDELARQAILTLAPAGTPDSQIIDEGGVEWTISLVNSSAGLGKVALTDNLVAATGHSLGGHLATAFTRLFSGWTTEAVTFNGAGYPTGAIHGLSGTALQNIPNLFSMLGGDAAFPAASITNIYGDKNIEFVTMDSFFGLQQPGVHQPMYIEQDTVYASVFGHGMGQMADSAAVLDLLLRLDGSLVNASVATIASRLNPLFEAASNDTAFSLESVVGALGRLFTGNGLIAQDDRESLYGLINDIKQTTLYQQSEGLLAIQPLTEFGGAAIAAKAQADTVEGLAYRYALANLVPFAITGDASIYASHNANGELNLYDPATGTGSLTNQYLKDRAAMLSWKLKYDVGAEDADDDLLGILDRDNKPYAEKWDSYSITDDWDFIDLAAIVSGAPLKIDIDGVDPITETVNHQIMFGSSNADTLTGDSLSDNLYGNAGADTLTGHAGNDYLEGGAGFDTYVINPGDGFDTLIDTDGLGVVNFGAVSAVGRAAVADERNWVRVGNRWTDRENGLSYLLIDQPDGSRDLFLSSASGSVLIKGWSEGELGIELSDNAPVVPPVTDRTIVGDLQPVDFNLTESGIQTQLDELGNVIVSGAAAPGREDVLYGSGGNDRIQSLGGNDYVDGQSGEDVIEGGTGQDLLVGGYGNDTVLGGADSDAIAGGADDDRLFADSEYTLETAYTAGETQISSGQRGDLLDGGDGDDVLVGEAGNDILMGGAGQDVLLGMGGDDDIEGDLGYASAGRDWSVERSITTEGEVTVYRTVYSFPWADPAIGGDDVIYGGTGSDWISGQGGKDFIDGGADGDALFGGADNDTILGQGGNDVVVGDNMHPDLDASLHGNDYLSGGAGDDGLWGGGGADVLDGGDGNDELYGDSENVPAEYEGDDTLDGGAGDDKLYGGGGNDALRGGSGADYLCGDAGDDTYLDVGAGDVIVDLEGRTDIRLAEANGVAAGTLPSVAATNDATLGIPLDDGTILQLQGALYGMNASIQFAGGESFDLERWVSENLAQSVSLNLDNIQLASGAHLTVVYGGAGADQIQGNADGNTLRGYGGDDLILGEAGNDLIDGGSGNDHLQGDAGEDTLKGGDGNDALLGLDDSDHLFGEAGNDELQGGTGVDALDGGRGDDTLFGEADDDTLDGGAGNDVLIGNSGNDTYLFGLGGGQDVIWEEGDSAGDVLRFGEGISSADLLTARTGSSLVFIRANGEEQVTVANWYMGAAWQLARFEFAGGTVWSGPAMSSQNSLLRGTSDAEAIQGASGNESLVGMDGDDQLDGGGGDDTLLGGKGNDTLKGGLGADTYLFASGDGVDVIDADTADSLRFTSDISSTDLSAERLGYDLVLRYHNGTDSVRIANWYGSLNDRLQQVVFSSDGTTWSSNVLSFMGTDYANHYTLDLGDGAKIIEEWGGSDSLTFGVGIAPTDILAARVGQDLRLAHLNGSDQVTLKGWFASTDGSAWVEEIRFADGTVWDAETLTLQALIQVGTGGGDYLYGIELFGDILRGGDGNDTLIGYGGDDVLEGGAGYDFLYGNAGNDALDVGGDGGYASGGSGDDLYLYEAGDANLDISESAGADTLRMGAGIRAEDVQFVREDRDLCMTLADGGRIRVGSWFNYADGSRMVERIEFVDGTTFTADQLNPVLLVATGTAGDDDLSGTDLNDTLIGAAGNDRLQAGYGNDALLGDAGQDMLYGGDGDDSLQGGEGDDLLFGESGNDELDGGVGDDYLAGGAGDDHYREAGAGQDRILDSAGLDTLHFASGIAPENLIVSRVDADLRIGFAGREDGVTLQEWFRQPRNSIEYFAFSDGRQWSAADINSAFSTISGNGSVTGGAGDDLLYGGTGVDTLQGSAGDDLVDGGAGADSLAGGAGNDTYIADAADTIVESPGEGNDTLVWTSSTAVILQDGLENLVMAESAGGATVTGNGADNRIVGNSADNNLDGGAGADILEGGLGSDNYVVDSSGDRVIERFNEGSTDTVHASITYTLGEQVEHLRLTGSDAIDGYGNALNNGLTGNDAANRLVGGAGNDSFTGGLGADVLVGGSGDDYYSLDGYDDLVLEEAGEGHDRVYIGKVSAEKGNISYVGTFTMAADVEDLRMNGYVSHASLYGNALDNVIDARGSDVFDHQSGYITWYYHAEVDITGGAGNDKLYAADGASILDGGSGDDVMYGGSGSNAYYVDSALDQVIERATSGSDSVHSSVSYTLGDNLESLYLLGSEDLDGIGNELSNGLYGNSGSNILVGGAGNDRLSGGGGNDTLIGGTGDDTYVMSAGAQIDEQADEGLDRVESGISYHLASNLEELVLTGGDAINGTGNELDNLIQGNSANNRLEGGVGNDTLDGGVGNDVMLGGAGDDMYYLDSTKDAVTEFVAEGTDTISTSFAYTLDANFENLVLTGAARINGTGNSLDNVIIGNAASNTLTGGAGNDRLDGGAGVDKLVGGAGDDTYIVDSSSETVTERAGEGSDRVLSGVTHTLSRNVENLTLTGVDAINGTGNTLANVIEGNGAANSLTGAAGNDTLDGMAGVDMLNGGTGNDTYVMGRGYGTDTVIEKDTTSGNNDVARFLSGVAADQIWFQRVGNSLETSIIGTDDRLVIQDWYLGNAYHVEQFKTADEGRTLLDSNVQNLVNAMAAFAPPAAGQTSLPQNYQDALAGVIAANWQ